MGLGAERRSHSPSRSNPLQMLFDASAFTHGLPLIHSLNRLFRESFTYLLSHANIYTLPTVCQMEYPVLLLTSVSLFSVPQFVIIFLAEMQLKATSFRRTWWVFPVRRSCLPAFSLCGRPTDPKQWLLCYQCLLDQELFLMWFLPLEYRLTE